MTVHPACSGATSAKAGIGISGIRDDPERGVLLNRTLAPHSSLAPISYGDWRASLVLDGYMTVGDATFTTDDWLIVEPGAKVPEVTVGAEGVHLLETARTAASCDPSELQNGAALR